MISLDMRMPEHPAGDSAAGDEVTPGAPVGASLDVRLADALEIAAAASRRLKVNHALALGRLAFVNPALEGAGFEPGPGGLLVAVDARELSCDGVIALVLDATTLHGGAPPLMTIRRPRRGVRLQRYLPRSIRARVSEAWPMPLGWTAALVTLRSGRSSLD